MELIEAQNTFAMRLYNWSERDLFRELQEDCPLLSLVGLNNRMVAGFVSWNKTLSSQDRLQLAKAKTLLAHRNARQIKEAAISDEIKYWADLCYKQTTLHEEHLPPLLTADRNSPTFRPIDPKHCLDKLIRTLPSEAGNVSREKSAVRWVRKFGDWKFVSVFTFQRRSRNLDCTFQFVRRDDGFRYPIPEAGPELFPRNFFAFYGLHNHTVVAVESEADSEPMARAMAKLAGHVFSHAEPLFGGLGLND